jgi:MFS family permease
MPNSAVAQGDGAHSGPAVAATEWVAKGAWYALAVLVAITLFAFVDRQVMILAAAPLARDLGLSDGQLGIVQGLAFAAFTTVAVFPLSWAADRFDRRLVLGLCIIVWSLGTAACGLAQSYLQLFLAAVAIAAGEAGLAPIIMAMIPSLFGGSKRALANSIFYFVSFVGISGGLALGGLALGWLNLIHPELPPNLQRFEAWRLAFFVVALPAPLFLLLLGLTRLGRRQPAAADLQAPRGAARFTPFLGRHWRPLTMIFSSIGLYMVAFQGYFIWLPVALTRIFGASPSENGFGMGAGSAVGMICGVALGIVLMRRFLPRLGAITALRLSSTVMAGFAPLLILFVFIAQAWQGYVLFGLMMVPGTMVGSLIPNILQDLAPEALRARIIAINTIFTGLLAGAAPTLMGFLSDTLASERGLLLAMFGISFPAWIAALMLMRLSEKPLRRLVAEIG